MEKQVIIYCLCKSNFFITKAFHSQHVSYMFLFLIAPGLSVNILTYVSYSHRTHSSNSDLKSVLFSISVFLCVPVLPGYSCHQWWSRFLRELYSYLFASVIVLSFQ